MVQQKNCDSLSSQFFCGKKLNQVFLKGFVRPILKILPKINGKRCSEWQRDSSRVKKKEVISMTKPTLSFWLTEYFDLYCHSAQAECLGFGRILSKISKYKTNINNSFILIVFGCIFGFLCDIIIKNGRSSVWKNKLKKDT